MAAVLQQTQQLPLLAELAEAGPGQFSLSPTRQRLQAVLADQPQGWRPNPVNRRTLAKLSARVEAEGFISQGKTVEMAEMADGQEVREAAAERLTLDSQAAPEAAEQTEWCR